MINFDESLHKYTDNDGRDYISVTQLLSLYKQPFDAASVAKRYAQRHGETPEYWIEQWENTKNEACNRGTLFHGDQEEQLLGRGVDVEKGRIFTVQNPAMFRMVKDLYELPDGLYPELRMWLAGYRVAGTGDKVFIETIGNLRVVDIDDHKTNKEIKQTSYFNGTSYKMMKHPIEHLMDCNWTHYALQISFYAYMMECMGFTPRNLQFTHYPHEDKLSPFESNEPVVYPLPYLREEVISILEHYRKHK